MGENLDSLATDVNREIIAHLGALSAHDGVVSALAKAVEPLGDVQTCCPDWKEYRYVVVATKQIIFGFAIGLNTIAFKLNDQMKETALISGASDYVGCGTG